MLLVLWSNISRTGRVDALRVSSFLLMLWLFKLIIEGLKLMRLFVYPVSCVWGALESVVTVLENVCLILSSQCFLSNLYFWTESIQRSLVRALLVLLDHEVRWSHLTIIEIGHLVVRHLLVSTLAHTFSLLLDGIIQISPDLLLNNSVETFLRLGHLVGWIYLKAFGIVTLGGRRAWVVPKHVSWVVLLFEYGGVLIIVSNLV